MRVRLRNLTFSNKRGGHVFYGQAQGKLLKYLLFELCLDCFFLHIGFNSRLSQL